MILHFSGRVNVLNAFRHQRSFQLIPPSPKQFYRMCSTPFGIKDPFRQATNNEWWLFICAQRLSASKNLSVSALLVIPTSVACSTPFGIKEPFSEETGIKAYCFGVLNAFRHQRTFQRSSVEVYEFVTECSTPFGIKEPFSQDCHNPKRPIRVLNAFRHQRTFQLIPFL